jgi:integrase
VRIAYAPGRWLVFRYDLDRPPPAAALVDLLSVNPALLTGLTARGRRHDQPFLIGPDGRADARVNAFFASPRMLARSPLTWRKYAQSIALWLNFLLAAGRNWDEASDEDAEYFKEWRLSDERNPRRVDGGTFAANLAALRAFYRWAGRRYGVADPVAAMDDFDLRPRGVRDRRVRWLDPGGYRRWRDLGLRGLDLNERTDVAWRGRNEQRDAAFADGLYGSGLRLSEWASVLIDELPEDDPARGYSTCRIADACAKGGYGRRFWLPRPALLAVLDYVEGARARAVRHAQRAGRYDRATVRLVTEVHGERLTIRAPDGQLTRSVINTIGPRTRRSVYRRTVRGLEPLALWLNEDGMPRPPHAWQHTFTQANTRIAALGLAGFSATPHMLRHSCALRWYAVGRLAYERRLGHLSEEETKDFRVQFGDIWDLVATILGHRSPETTKRHYLEPFRVLDVDLLLQHAQQAAVEGFLASYLADHPLVRSDPLRVPR